MAQTWDIIDIHAHIRPPDWRQPIPADATESERHDLAERGRKLTDISVLVRESEEGDVALRLLSSTVEGFFGIEGPTDAGRIAAVNDHLAELVARHPARLGALATVDAFSGDAGAREAERAVTRLGHAGIVIDSSRDGEFLSAATVRPTLEVAASLKVPVFVHPVGAPNSPRLTRSAGKPGYGFGRGWANGTAFLSVLHARILDDLPDLNLIFTALGAGALILATAETDAFSAEARAAGGPRPNVYFDIMGLNPQVIRFLVDTLGADRVVTGSDWPIWAPVTRGKLSQAFAAAGLTAEQQALVAGGNARRLLDLRRGDEKLERRA